MLTPKSLLTWITDRRRSPRSSAYFAAATPWSASVVIVRKNQPPLFPSRPRFVRVGDDEAGEIWTTPEGAVTDVRTGMETDEMMPPMMAGTRLISTSCLAASTATVPWLWASRISAASRHPATPPASFRSRKASSTAFEPACPNWPAGPVRDITTPIVVVHCASTAPGPGQRQAQGGDGRETPPRTSLEHELPPA